MALIHSKWILKKKTLWVMNFLPGTMAPVIDLMIYFTLLLMVLTLNFIKYDIKIMPNLGICKLKYLIPPKKN